MKLRHLPQSGTDSDHDARGDDARERRARAELRGRFLIAEPVVQETERLLRSYRGVDGDHEGMVFLCGRELGETMLLTTAIAPACEHSFGRVMADHSAVGYVTRSARQLGLGVLAQIHSHPCGQTQHSEGDDYMVLMPFERMLSIVVPHYGATGLRPFASLGVHQFQDDRWRLVSENSIRRGMTLLPAGLDLR